MKNIIWENIVKNILVFIILIPAYLEIQNFFLNSSFSSDKSIVGSLLVAVSTLAVIACFGNFAFTYEKVANQNSIWRIVSHLTTGLLMLIIGLMLGMTAVLTKLLIGDFFLFDLTLFTLYFSISLI